jgi:hypothetical protein
MVVKNKQTDQDREYETMLSERNLWTLILSWCMGSGESKVSSLRTNSSVVLPTSQKVSISVA